MCDIIYFLILALFAYIPRVLYNINMRVSYSALQTYENCPLKFKYQVLDKIRAPKSIEAVFGTIVHSALKRIFQRSPLFPTLDETIDFFNDKWSNLSNQEFNEESLRAYHEEGLNMIKNFYKKNPPWNFNVVELESRFEITLEDGKNEEVHVLAGIIDRIDKSPDSDKYEIIDYKTSKRMPSQSALDNDLQLSIYNLGLMKRWPHLNPENIKLSLYYLKHNEKIETKRTAAGLEKTKKEIIEKIREIQSTKEFVATPSALCDWCGYKKICPMWKHLYQNQESRIKNQEEIEALINQYFGLKDQNSQNNKKLKEIQADIYGFMESEKVDRVFGEAGYLTKSLQERTGYDMPKIKKILEDMGRWDEVSKKKQFITLKATKNKSKKPKN